ncbi:hypothetical protein JAAARDRAFT_36447 [Jaapia argillacea MUCL 33604]|uniref:Elongator complex protein 1 n=1 Tax=Jaapia argillacea MUCL 33604 TaxID=933084 RepID=A0A067PNA3_9AGAM|nr:hypothetical protein JAAARDRAFT_36447 [Jaapia argillacea MUCL 33604]
MRNLTLTSTLNTTLALPTSHTISNTTFNLDQNLVYASSERISADAEVEVDIWGVDAEGEATILTTLTSFTVPDAQPPYQVISLHFISETHSLVAILHSGDILTIPLNSPFPEAEVVGTTDSPILAAEWSPDDSLLVLITSTQNLILMTSSFDVLSESSLNTDEFGEETPINVGWGSKSTQFHGSLGKGAALSPSTQKIGCSPDDDGLPRISWRGDASFFVTSSLSQGPSSKHRVLRVYNPQATLQSTSELIPGLEHVVAWRPSGNLVVASQRFGDVPGGGARGGGVNGGLGGGEGDGGRGEGGGLGSGRQNRHDIVFFERNGLRHGEFSIREGDLSAGGFANQIDATPTDEIDSKPAAEIDSEPTPEIARPTAEITKPTTEIEKKWGYRVKEVSWSSDSRVLGVWYETGFGDVVQLYTTSNYHWYLKQEILAPSDAKGKGRFTSVVWHPEEMRVVLCTRSKIIQRTYTFETSTSRSLPPHDTGSVGVIDGPKILLTPFRTQNVPPPMSSYQLSLNHHRVPIHFSFSSPSPSYPSPSEILAVLYESSYLELYALHTRLPQKKKKGGGKVMDPRVVWEGNVRFEGGCRQVLVSECDQGGEGGEGGKGEGKMVVVILGAEGGKDLVSVIELLEGAEVESKGGKNGKEEGKWEMGEKSEIRMSGVNGRLVPVGGGREVMWQAPDGELFQVQTETETISPISQFPEFCLETECIPISPSPWIPNPRFLFVGFSSTSSKLYITLSPSPTPYTLATNVTSFTIASGFVIYTTTAHLAHFAPIASLISLLTSQINGDTNEEEEVSLKLGKSEWEQRRVERGSRIVVAVPSTMSLVLQMPRGNLETVNPRPLVMEVVKQDINAGDYRKAFLACRKHRIDLNVLVEHDQESFMVNLESFVEQIDDVEYMNLFLTSIGRGTQSIESIAKICDSIRLQLEKVDLKKYVNSILTAYVVKNPPDHEAALSLLLRLRDSEPSLVEDAVKYIIFLVDAERLLDTAIGMYDFSIFLMIAQHAQKDPREYLPFLRELRALEKYYQRFRIDDHLRRHEKALRNLSLAGPERFEEAMTYVEKHRLYQLALSLWKGTERYEAVLDVYGDWLFERREFKQAALAFLEAGKRPKAMIAHEKALEWQELFDLAMVEQMSEDEITDMGYRVAEDLSSKKRFSEAARVLLDYVKDVRQAVIALVEGHAFSEARRIVTLQKKPDLLTEIIYPGTLETRAQIGDDISEMRDQLRKQVTRLRELRVKKVEEPDSFYGVEDTDLHNVDVMTDISQAPTTFTRYTVAPSAASKTSSKRSSRSKRKMERKVGSGRKGTVDEEEYLLKSITKLVARFTTAQGETSNLLPHLLQFTPEHRAEGISLQSDLAAFEVELKQAVEEVWTRPPSETQQDEEGAVGDGWAKRMEQIEKNRMVNPLDKVVKPDVSAGEWRIPLLDIPQA